MCKICFFVFLHQISWLCAYMFTWFIFVKILVASKFPKHIILYFEKVSIFRPLIKFQNFFNYAIWNFEMIFENLKPPTLFFVYHLFFQKKMEIKLFLIGGEKEFSMSFKITYSIQIFWTIQVILKGGEIKIMFLCFKKISNISL